MRFNDDTTLAEFLAAVEPVMQHLDDRDELTEAQEMFGAACEFARRYPESQTARDLLAWAHSSTPGGCVEAARAERIEDWIAEEDLEAFDAISIED